MSSVFQAIFGQDNQAPQVSLELMTCVSCGIAFGAPADFFNTRRKDGKSFYCPNGHSLKWTKTEADKLREQLAEKERRIQLEREQTRMERERREAAERRAAAARGQVTRIKNRIVNGVCPCCKRTFKDLHRHMTSKHPDYAQNEE